MITLDLTAPQIQRLRVAFGGMLRLVDEQGNPRLATAQEIKAEVWGWLRNKVRNYEQIQAAKNIAIAPFDEGI